MKRLVVALALLWMVKWFNSAEDLVAFVNGLTPEQQASAKVITAPSSRNVGGWFGQPYGLLFEVKK